jgi:thiamine-phosphate pyrophosphorylase
MICLVTDRRRLVAHGAPSDASFACLAAQVRYAVEAGIDLVQVREHDLEAGALAALVTSLLTITRGSRTRLVVNDRLDVALVCGADGVHLRSDSVSVEAARRIAPSGFLVGRSVHGPGEAAGAGAAADYLIAGTVFPSASKAPGTRLVGLDGLRSIVDAVHLPVLAIGGMSSERIAQAASAGASGIAAISLFIPAHDDAVTGGCRAGDLRRIVNDARSRFDRLNTTP